MKNKYGRNLKITEVQFRALIRLFAMDIPALTASKLVALNRNTLQRYYDAVRLRVFEEALW